MPPKANRVESLAACYSMRFVRRRVFAAVAASLTVCACASHVGVGVLPSASSPVLDQPLALRLADADGQPISVRNAEGRPTVLYFWAPTCQACGEKVPQLLDAEPMFGERRARLVLVGVLDEDESAEDARAALASWGVDRPFLVVRDRASQRRAGLTELPKVMVLDGHGVVSWVAPRGSTAQDILSAVPD